MDTNLQGLRQSYEWRRKKLTGYITLKGRDLSDREVRTVVEMGINKVYRTLYQIPDEEAEEWLNKKTRLK